MDASLLEPIFACWPAIGRESYQLAGTGESWAKCESQAATRQDFLKNGKSLSKIRRPSAIIRRGNHICATPTP
jgi:hypothetical protein